MGESYPESHHNVWELSLKNIYKGRPMDFHYYSSSKVSYTHIFIFVKHPTADVIFILGYNFKKSINSIYLKQMVQIWYWETIPPYRVDT